MPLCRVAASSGVLLDRALRAVEGGEAEVLVVAKLDRLSRSLLDFAAPYGSCSATRLELGCSRPRH